MTGACTKSYMEISTIQCLYWFMMCKRDKYHGQAYNCDKILLTTGSRLTFFQLRWYKICLALCLLSVQVYHPSMAFFSSIKQSYSLYSKLSIPWHAFITLSHYKAYKGNSKASLKAKNYHHIRKTISHQYIHNISKDILKIS